MIRQLFVFRHGETDWNRARRFQGHTDIPLNETGQTQARSLKSVFESCQPQIILSSDLSRAHKTAQILNESLRLEIVTTPTLRECLLGAPEGQTLETIIEKYGEDSWESWKSGEPKDVDFCYPGGEKKSDHLRRMIDFIESYFDSSSHQKIAISTHGGSLNRLINHCKNAPHPRPPIANASLFELEFHPSSRSYFFKRQIEADSLAKL